MKRLSKKLLPVVALMTAMVVLLAMPAMAAESSVKYEGVGEVYVFAPGSSYSSTDLFDNFKGMMPGDTRTETIIVKNNLLDSSQYVKIYMRAELHDETSNPMSPSVAAEETLTSMHDFLHQLSMTVKQGSKVIYQASPDKLDGLAENVLLGEFDAGEQTELTVTLSVPTTLGNEYANRIGEVDWVFTAEQFKKNTPIYPRVPSVTLEAEKTVDGKTPKDSYTFLLKDESGAVVQSVENNGSSIVFDTMSFDKTGTYVYYITEQAGSNANMIYDSAEYKVIIEVTKPKIDYEASVSYEKDGESYTGTLTFNNETKPDEPDPPVDPDTKSVQVKLGARKLFDGKTPTEQYTFLLKDSTGALVEEKKNDGENISFRTITLESAGTYVYYISEQIGNDSEVVYDTSKYKAIVTVTEADGALSANIAYEKDGAAYSGTPVFNNTSNPTTDVPEGPGTGDTEKPDEPVYPDKPDKPDIPDVPKTGDDTNTVIWKVMMGVGVLCMVGVLIIGIRSYLKEPKKE